MRTNRTEMTLLVAVIALLGGGASLAATGGSDILRQALESRPSADDELRYQQELDAYEEELERYDEAQERYEEALETYEERKQARREEGDSLPPPIPPVEPTEPEPPERRSTYAPPAVGLGDALEAVDGLQGPLTVLLTALVPLGVAAGGVLLALGMNRGMQLVMTSVATGALVLLGQGIVL